MELTVTLVIVSKSTFCNSISTILLSNRLSILILTQLLKQTEGLSWTISTNIYLTSVGYNNGKISLEKFAFIVKL